jgi:hypothetical protein
MPVINGKVDEHPKIHVAPHLINFSQSQTQIATLKIHASGINPEENPKLKVVKTQQTN